MTVSLSFVGIKIVIGVNLISFATSRQPGVEARAEADTVNDFGRDPIGEGAEERTYNGRLKSLLDHPADDAEAGLLDSERELGANSTKTGRKRVRLEDLTRFTMVKRIW